MKARITKRLVESLSAGETVFDTDVSGFGVRGGRRYSSYFLKCFYRGRQRWHTIGKHGSPFTAEQARKSAVNILLDLKNGIDPDERKGSANTDVTVAEFSERYISDYAELHKKPRSVRLDRTNIRHHIVPLLGRKSVRSLTRSDIAQFHKAVAGGETAKLSRFKSSKGVRVKGGKTAANRCLTLLSKMMNLAEDWGLRDEHSNPVYRVKRVTEHRRERYLSADEFSRLGKVLDEAERTNRHSAFAIGAVRLLLLTGARLNEILALRWESVDLDQKIIMLPDSKTGPKPIRLSPQAINLLRSMPRRAGNPYVICGRRSGCHLANLQGVWDEVRHAAGLSDVRIHDLRHAFASVASSKGFSLQIIGALLGHKRIETTERYAHLQRDQVATANDAVAEGIELMLSGGNR